MTVLLCLHLHTQVIQATTTTQLEEQVALQAKHGWIASGPISVLMTREMKVYAQALVSVSAVPAVEHSPRLLLTRS